MSSFLLKIMTLATYRCDVRGGWRLVVQHIAVSWAFRDAQPVSAPNFALATSSRPLPEPFVRHGISVQAPKKKM